MNARRRLPAAACSVLLLAVLSGCEKPAPIVTLVNAGQSVYAEANVFCFEGQSDAEGNCSTREQGVTTLEVEGGQPLGIDVAKELSDRGWVAFAADDSGQGSQEPQQVIEVQREEHYAAFEMPRLRQGGALLLTVRALGPNDDGSSGEWRFRLVPR